MCVCVCVGGGGVGVGSRVEWRQTFIYEIEVGYTGWPKNNATILIRYFNDILD